MSWLPLTISAGLVLVGAVVAATATSPRRIAAAPGGSATVDQAALGKSIRAYLLANPEVLVDAMQELERKQDSQRDAVAQKGVAENQAELYRDPDSPVGGNPNGDVVIVEFNDYIQIIDRKLNPPPAPMQPIPNARIVAEASSFYSTSTGASLFSASASAVSCDSSDLGSSDV